MEVEALVDPSILGADIMVSSASTSSQRSSIQTPVGSAALNRWDSLSLLVDNEDRLMDTDKWGGFKRSALMLEDKKIGNEDQTSKRSRDRKKKSSPS